MGAILFDTLRLSRTLRDKGHFTPEQAEALAEALGEAAQNDLATKADLAALKADMATKADLAALKADMATKADLAALKADMATKADLAALRAELKADIAAVRAELKADIAEVKVDILKWVVGAIGFQTVVILGALVSLIKIFAK
jgi:Protein of unknown function (DUF1640).